MNRYSNLFTNISIIENAPQDIHSNYKCFGRWLKDRYNEDKESVYNNNLTYLTESFEEVGSDIDHAIRDSLDNYLKLVNINKMNKELFKELLWILKDEYNMLRKKDSTELYREYLRVISWHKETVTILTNSLNNLSFQEISVGDINFKNIEKEELEIEYSTLEA